MVLFITLENIIKATVATERVLPLMWRRKGGRVYKLRQQVINDLKDVKRLVKRSPTRILETKRSEISIVITDYNAFVLKI